MAPKEGTINITDWSKGLATTPGPMSLDQSQSPDFLNYIPMPGRTRYRGGASVFCALPYQIDDIYEFIDSGGTKHLATWAGGNLYDCVNGVAVMIASAVTPAGFSVCYAAQNGVLYWSPPPTATNRLQFWNPVAGTFGNVASSGQPGSVTPPPCTWLIDYNGSLVALNPYLNGVKSFGTFVVANVDDPSTWLGINTTAPGGHDESYLSFALATGISGDGILSSQSLIIGRSSTDIFAYSGPATTLTQLQISSPVGCLDGHTAVYIPDSSQQGHFVFLGTDYQFWMSDGQNAKLITNNILEYCYNAVLQAIQTIPLLQGLPLNKPLPPNVTLFSGAYNPEYAYYVCDLGSNKQIGYRWETQAFFPLAGWPSGIFQNNTNNAGYPQIIVGGRNSLPSTNQLLWDTGKWDAQFWTGSSYAIYSLGVDSASDAGNTPSIYWRSPWLHAGNFQIEKLWEWIDCCFVQNNTSYTLTVTGWPQWNGYQQVSPTYTYNLPNPFANTSGLYWDVGQWDVNQWQQTQFLTLNTPVHFKSLIGATIPASVALEYGLTPAQLPLENLTSGAVQLTISYNGGNLAFDLISVVARYMMGSEIKSGSEGYDPDAGFVENANPSPNDPLP